MTVFHPDVDEEEIADKARDLCHSGIGSRPSDNYIYDHRNRVVGYRGPHTTNIVTDDIDTKLEIGLDIELQQWYEQKGELYQQLNRHLGPGGINTEDVHYCNRAEYKNAQTGYLGLAGYVAHWSVEKQRQHATNVLGYIGGRDSDDDLYIHAKRSASITFEGPLPDLEPIETAFGVEAEVEEDTEIRGMNLLTFTGFEVPDKTQKALDMLERKLPTIAADYEYEYECDCDWSGISRELDVVDRSNSQESQDVTRVCPECGEEMLYAGGIN